MALVSRDRARTILEHLVENLDQLERVTSISEIYINPNFDSELEARFIESLRRLSGVGGLPFIKLVQEIVQGKSGYLIQVGEQRYWVEPQVDLGPNDGVSVPCRPDFVLRPTQSLSQRRAIAVFCDGWAYHNASTREDANKRSALLVSGKFWVWSVTWEDVTSAMEGKLETALADGLEAMCFNQIDNLPPALRSMLNEPWWTQHAVAVLLQWLGTPTGDSGDQFANRLAHHAGATAFRMVPNPVSGELAEARAKLMQFWNGMEHLPCDRSTQSVACGNLNDPALSLRYWWPSELTHPAIPAPPSPGFVILNEARVQDEPQRHLTWRRWLWLFNIFQTLPGVLLSTQPGLDAGDHEGLILSTGTRSAAGASGATQAAAWETVIAQAMECLADDLHALMEAGLPPPDEVGYELEQEGEVVAEAELAWPQRKLVLLMPAHTANASVWDAHGWKALIAQDDWQQRLAEELGNHTDQEDKDQKGQQ
jgi:DEAD/DEAH box helicase domain-containing protein